MRVRRSIAVVGAVAALAGCGSSGGSTTVESDVTRAVRASNAWARDTAAGQENAAVYLQVRNGTDRRQVLVGARVPARIATAASLHESTTSGHDAGSMTGMHMTPRVGIAARGTVVFRPGGRHIMLTGLAAPLHAGDRFPITIGLAGGTAIRTTVTVRPL